MQLNMFDKVTAPFTDEQVEQLNRFQQAGRFHPFTCCSTGPADICERRLHTGDGELIATADGWVCPCGHYTQTWAHGFMADGSTVKPSFGVVI